MKIDNYIVNIAFIHLLYVSIHGANIYNFLKKIMMRKNRMKNKKYETENNWSCLVHNYT